MAGAAPSPLNNNEERADELSPHNIINYLEEIEQFTLSAQWTLLLRLLGVNTDNVHKSILAFKTDNNVDLHLEDCLDIWLKQDLLSSWQNIYNAIEYIMRHERATVVFKIFWPKIPCKMSEKDNIHEVIGRLEAEKIITPDFNTSSGLSIEALFESLHSFIERSPTHNLLTVFNTLTSFFSCFRELKSSFEVECDVCLLELPRTPGPPKVPLSPVLKGDFDEVIQGYNFLIANIIENISERLNRGEISDSSLRRRLIGSGECDEPDSTTVKLIQDYIKESSSVINTKQIKNLCKRFGSQDILKDIDDYEKRRQELCNTLTTDQLIGKLLGTIKTMGCNTITFTVKWDAKKTKMYQIEELLHLAFDNCECVIHVTNVREGNSFTVTCYAPEAIIGLLIFKAQKNLSSLKEKGVIFLKIGYCTLLDHKRKYEINTEFIDDRVKNEIEELKAHKENLIAEVKQLRITLEEHEIDIPSDITAVDSELLSSKLQSRGKEKLESSADTIRQENLLTEQQHPIKEHEVDQPNITADTVDPKLCSKSPDEVKLYSDTEKLKEIESFDASIQDSKLLYDDDSLSEEPVKMKPSLEVEKGQKSVVVTIIEEDSFDEFETEPKEYSEREGEWEMKEKRMKNMYKELEQLQAEKKLMSGKLMNLEDKNTYLESNLKELKESNEQQQSTAQLKRSLLESRIPTLYDGGDTQYPPVDIIMTQFTKRKSANEYWYSPCFYTHPGGYKLCMKLVPSGQDKGEGTHLSMYVHMMSGEHDDLLAWPFMGVVKVQLRNRKGDRNHFPSIIVYDESTNSIASERVGSGPRTPSGIAARIGKGHAQWIGNEDLLYNSDNDTQYLKDDCVIVRVNEVTVDQSRVPAVVTPPTSPDVGGATPTYIAEFRVPNFDQLKKSKKRWESDGFYTLPNESGYKFLVAVHPYGKDQYKGERVSVYTHLMKGKNDDNLRFPFRGSITVQLVNQRENKNHAEHRITYTKEDDPLGFRGGRIRTVSPANLISGRSYGGWGYAGFIKHEYLPYNKNNNTQYLTDNNELVFRIVNVEHSS